MPWVNDKIRIFYTAGVGERILGKELDSRAPAEEGREAEAINSRLKVVENLNFSQAPDFKG